MSRVNIYLPDALARRAREAGLNVSGVAQEALERELRVSDFGLWMDGLRTLDRGVPVPEGERARIMDEVRAELGRAADKRLDGHEPTSP